MSISIKLDNFTARYQRGDFVKGGVISHLEQANYFTTLELDVLGTVNFINSNIRFPVIEGNKPIPLTNQIFFQYHTLLLEKNVFNKGDTLPFQFLFDVPETQELYNTYHGHCIRIDYVINISGKRRFFQSILTFNKEIYLYQDPHPPPGLCIKPYQYKFHSRHIKNNNMSVYLPDFRINFSIDNTNLISTNYEFLNGVFNIEYTDCSLDSIVIHIIQLETVFQNSQEFNEKTICQSFEVITGSVPIRKDIGFTFNTLTPLICPFIETATFHIHFCLKVDVTFEDGTLFHHYVPLSMY